MEVLGPATPSLSNDEIIAKYPRGIEELTKAATDPNYDFERQIYVNQARLNWQFIKGNHFNVPGMITSPFGQIADYIPFDPQNGSEETGPDVKLCPPINVIGGDCFKYMAVMGMSSPNVKGVADDAQDSQSLDQAHAVGEHVAELLKLGVDQGAASGHVVGVLVRVHEARGDVAHPRLFVPGTHVLQWLIAV